MRKYAERVRIIPSLRLGHVLSVVAYRMLAVSCLGYCMQILPLRNDWMAKQTEHLRILVRGPGGWIPTTWLTRPALCVQLPSLAVDLELLHRATLMKSACEKLSIAGDMACSIDALANTEDMVLYHPWNDWLFLGIPHALRGATREASDVLAADRRRCKTQVKLYGALLKESRINNDASCWDRRLARWRGLSTAPPFPRQVRARVCEVLKVAARLPTSSRWALVRTWLNGWCTKRRFQQKGACLFCHLEEDSIEHFSCCRLVRKVGQRLTGIPQRVDDRLDFLLLDNSSSLQGLTFTKQVAYLHALYNAHNSLRINAAAAQSAPSQIRNHLRGLLMRHPSLRAAFPGSLPLVGDIEARQ